MRIVTVATHCFGRLQLLKQQSNKLGYGDPVVLGWGRKYTGHMFKDEQVLKWCKSQKDKTEIVCFVDGFDSVVLLDPDQAMLRYNKIVGSKSVKLVVSADGVGSSLPTDNLYNIFWSYFYIRSYPTLDGAWINSGMYMGEIREIEKLMIESIKHAKLSNVHVTSNQRNWVDLCIKRNKRGKKQLFVVDRTGVLFFNFIDLFHTYKGNVTLTEDSSGVLPPKIKDPCAFISGPADSKISPILYDMGLDDGLVRNAVVKRLHKSVSDINRIITIYPSLLIPELTFLALFVVVLSWLVTTIFIRFRT